MKRKIAELLIIPLICLLTLTGCIISQQFAWDARVLNKNGNICFAVENKSETRRYPMKIAFINFSDGRGKIGDKVFDQKEKGTPIVPKDCISVDYKFEKNIFYEVGMRIYINKGDAWDIRPYHKKFYLTEGSRGVVVHSYPFSDKELKRDKPLYPFPEEELRMKAY